MNKEEIIGAFLLANIPEIITQEELDEVKIAIKELQQENKQLKEKLDKYENPEDMTLFSMWCTEKVKDENQQLKERVDTLKETQIKQLQIIEDKDKKIYKALHRIQLLQMDGEVSTKDLGEIANILIDKEVE